MRLVKFQYYEPSWDMDNMVELENVALFVGQNAMGKSKLIERIKSVVKYILQLKEPSQYTNFVMTLGWEDEQKNQIEYLFNFLNGEVDEESMWFNKEKILKRKKGTPTMLKGKTVNPPENKLVVGTQRDVILYPEFEKIVKWAESVVCISFNELDILGDKTSAGLGLKKNLYDIVKDLSPESKDKVIEAAKRLNYPISKISAVSFGDIRKVTFKEDGVPRTLMDTTTSKGMFRALYLLILIEYLSSLTTSNDKLLIIDDMCEGLDYARSISLGKEILHCADEQNIQLIMSSNDNFLMDVVDLHYWQIIQREGVKISTINHSNSPKLFENFKYTGLSNFDFFSSDFIKRQQQKDEQA